ncbi:F-box protein [Phanerochaete sordida]|uniref:F-box protein n=1 Tax=Phanerochaete sordida TaxID=48140 RepID=A0A9P3LGN8_9APHY|nr:F-box protein [Phanerochaete sordida]
MVHERGSTSRDFWKLASRIQGTSAQLPGSWNSLPTELLVQILRDLPVADVLVCKRVNRTFHTTISASAEIQQKIKCFDANVIDGRSSPFDLVQRMSRVSAWADTWRTLQVTGQPMVLRPNESPWNYRSGSIFSCQTPSNRGISFYHLPSPQRDILYQQWTIPDLGYEPVFVCHDYTQELVVVATNNDDAFGSCARFHLLHDKTGDHHHEASERYLQLPAAIPRVTQEDHDLHIFGELLGLVVHVDDLFDITSLVISTHLLIFNWKTGTLLKHLTGDLLSHEIVFVDERHFLIPFAPQTLPGAYLAVVDCYRRDPDTHDEMLRGAAQEILLKHASLLLQLPPVLPAAHVEYQIVHAMSSTGTQGTRVRPPGRPFYVDYAPRLIVLSILIGEQMAPADLNPLTLLVPAPAVLARLAEAERTPGACAVLPWVAWAADTRAMHEPMEDICAARFLTSVYVDGRRRVTVWDFASVPALLRDVREPAEGVSVPPPEPLPGEGLTFEACGVLTGAPCRRVVSNLEVPRDRTVRLYEDGFVVYTQDPRDEVQVYAI